MMEQTNNNLQQEGGNAPRGDQNVSKNDPISASDASRNDERDQRIQDEKGTERLRSERQSVRDKKKDRIRVR